MKNSLLKRFAVAVLLLVQCVSLAGCGRKDYEEGYEAGFAAAAAAVATVPVKVS